MVNATLVGNSGLSDFDPEWQVGTVVLRLYHYLQKHCSLIIRHNSSKMSQVFFRKKAFFSVSTLIMIKWNRISLVSNRKIYRGNDEH